MGYILHAYHHDNSSVR